MTEVFLSVPLAILGALLLVEMFVQYYGDG